ncbi:MAG TPA: flavin reductase family protein [Phycisphaerae bacterium]|nr:flavin reductase family protein [Phycisphaerae bacterium]
MNQKSNDEIARVIGRIPSGCSILTVRTAGKRTGMLASWVQQAAFEPPMVSVAVKRDRPIEKFIDEAGGFVLNLLGENPTQMFKHFGKGFSPEEDAFGGMSVREVPYGVVIPDQIAWLSARVRAKNESGDHWIYLGEVTEAGGDGGLQPYVHLRKNGLSY